VVLPFANLGGDPGQDHIADGVTDELTAALARIPGGYVVGRGAALAYKGLPVDVRQIGRDLGVRYVVQGSTRRVGPQLQVNAQVLDAATGAHLWSESFEEPFIEAADLTREVASRIAAGLSKPLVWIESERARADRGHDPTAVDLLMRGRALLNARATIEDLLEARRLFERSLALDGSSADAHALLGMNLTNLWVQGWGADREGLLRRAEEHATRALEINPWHSRAHYLWGTIHQGRQRFDEALAAYRIALDLAPRQPFVHTRLGWVRNLTGRPEEALADFAQAVRISPNDPYVGTAYSGMAVANLMLGRDGEAAAHAARAAAGTPGLPYVHLQSTATLALVGWTEEARTALAEYRRLRPGTTVESFRRRVREVSDHPLWLATRDREAEALRAVGMPAE
jgi:TolB-like protein